ncbi:MAG: fasciclin domain-containing protein [Lacibacter sp.]
MKKILFAFSSTAFLMIASIVTVKGQDSSLKAEIMPVAVQQDIVDIAGGSPEHTMLVKAITDADLVKVFKMNGPYTVFAPTNAAFDKIPAADRTKLMKNKAGLAKVLKYHVVGGNWNSVTLMAAIKQGNGVVELPTLAGNKLKATIEDGKVKLTDEGGNACFVTNADIMASNGVIHIVDAVAMPMQQVTAAKK